MVKTGVCCQLFSKGIFAYHTINNVCVLILKEQPEDQVVLNICVSQRSHSFWMCLKLTSGLSSSLLVKMYYKERNQKPNDIHLYVKTPNLLNNGAEKL